jgi:hypothetical protein
MTKIYILWCTIRPEQFIITHNIWVKNSYNVDNISTYVVVNNEKDKNIISSYLPKDNIFNLNTTKIGVCYPSYYLSSRIGIEYVLDIKPNDIIVFASDDFTPPKDWDIYLINKLNNKENSALMVRDGYQLSDSSNMLHPAITIPIMTYGALLKLNRYIYHPDYLHMFSDCELYLNLKELDILIDDRINDNTTFIHHHHASRKRKADINDRIYYSNWKVDENKWNIRKNMNLIDRLK